MDKRLLYLEKYLSMNNPEISLAEYINVSKRQLSRLLNQWHDEGYINYSPAVGRGGKMEITFEVDVEKELFSYALKHLKDMTLQDIKSYVELPWDEESKEVIVRQLKSNFLTKQDNNNSIIDFVYSIPEDLNPLTAQSLMSFQVITQMMRTLYTLDEDNNIQNELVKYDEWQGNTLHVYLHQDNFFPNRKRLNATIVFLVLNRLFYFSRYKKYFEEVTSIEFIDDFQIAITVKKKSDHIKYLLTEPYSSIYIEEDGELIGTGPYYLKSLKQSELTLQVNPYYKRLVQIERIHFVQNRKRFLEYITSDKYGVNKTKRFYSVHGFFLVNPSTSLTYEERKSTIETLQSLIYDSILSQSKYVKWIADIPGKVSKLSHSTRPVRLLIDTFNQQIFEDVIEEINKDETRIELISVSYDKYISTPLDEFDVDIVWMTESMHQQQPFKLYDMLLHCKFKEWYFEKPQFLCFFKSFNYDHLDNLTVQAETLLKDLSDNYYYSSVLMKEKVFLFTKAIEYIDVNHYGFIDYGNIILK